MAKYNYSITLVLNRSRIELIEAETQDKVGLRTFDLWLDGKLLKQIEMLGCTLPNFAVRCGEWAELVIWVESDVYLLRLSKKRDVKLYEHTDAVHAAYAYKDIWCLVGDMSVTLVDIFQSKRRLRYVHNEIFISSYWHDDSLVLEDLQGKTFVFENFDCQPEQFAPSSQSRGL